MPAEFVARVDSMTQATATYAAVETGVDGSTPGSVKVASGRSRLGQLKVAALTDGAASVDTGNGYFLEIGKNATDAPHEILGSVTGHQEIGTVAAATDVAYQVFPVPSAIGLKASSDLSLRGAYRGADPGTPEIWVELALE